jgi:hypothetical protein
MRAIRAIRGGLFSSAELSEILFTASAIELASTLQLLDQQASTQGTSLTASSEGQIGNCGE